jgi:hypoxanthine phosphoribosyltransferase
MKCRLVTWVEVHEMCKGLAEKIQKSNYKPETIIALARSGFVPGRLLSDMLGITDLVCLKVEHWLDMTGEHKDKATIPYRIPFKVEGRRVLVVDDIVDTGKSMTVSVDYLKHFKSSELKVAVMQYITASEYVPEYYAVKVDDWVWFIYPWNQVEDLSNLTVRLMKSHAGDEWTLRKINEGFKDKYGLEVGYDTLTEVASILERRGKLLRSGDVWKIP